MRTYMLPSSPSRGLRLALGCFAALLAAAISLAVAVSLAVVSPSVALARDFVEVGAPCSLAVENAPTEVGGGVELSLYRVASVSQTGEVGEPCEGFAGYAVNLAPADESGWRALAQTLSAYVARDGVAPVATAEADAAGRASFAGLPTGLYLLVADVAPGEGAAYSVEPVMVQLPGLDASSGADAWAYDATASLKWGTDVLARVSAVKVWKDDDGEDRPASVTVQLLRDGAVADEAVLSAENGWRHTWGDLDPSATWLVAEADVPEGYAVSVSREGSVFTVVNTAKTPLPETPGDEPGDKPGDDTTGGGTRLPQTGQLWWPVPVLLAAGAALLVAGVARRNSRVR